MKKTIVSPLEIIRNFANHVPAATQGRRTKGVSRPVSEKFYAALRGRVEEACGVVPQRAATGAEVLEAVDSYLAGNDIVLERLSLLGRVVFLLLRPEIDKAVSRSAAARSRAGRRRKGSDSVKEEAATFAAPVAAPLGSVAAPAQTFRSVDGDVYGYKEEERDMPCTSRSSGYRS